MSVAWAVSTGLVILTYGVQNSSNRRRCIVGVVCIWSSHAMINAGEFGMWIANKGCKITNKRLKNRTSWYVGQQHKQPKICECMILNLA